MKQLLLFVLFLTSLTTFAQDTTKYDGLISTAPDSIEMGEEDTLKVVILVSKIDTYWICGYVVEETTANDYGFRWTKLTYLDHNKKPLEKDKLIIWQSVKREWDKTDLFLTLSIKDKFKL